LTESAPFPVNRHPSVNVEPLSMVTFHATTLSLPPAAGRRRLQPSPLRRRAMPSQSVYGAPVIKHLRVIHRGMVPTENMFAQLKQGYPAALNIRVMHHVPAPVGLAGRQPLAIAALVERGAHLELLPQFPLPVVRNIARHSLAAGRFGPSRFARGRRRRLTRVSDGFPFLGLQPSGFTALFGET